MTEARTSFVMAARDAMPMITETLQSVLAQTDGDFELVIVDDGSRDSTPEVLRAFASMDSRIRVMTNPVSVGLTRSLIIGCAAARGEFIARQDAGDLSHPHRLALQRACLDEDASLSFVSCWTEFVGPELEPLYVVRGSGVATEPIEIIDLTRNHGTVDGPTSHPSVLFRRSAYEHVGGYRPQFYFGQDWDLWYRLAAVGRFQTVPQALYTARVTPGDLSSSSRTAQARLASLSLAALEARSRGESEASILELAAAVRPPGDYRRGRRHDALYFVGEALRQNHDDRARRYFLRAIGQRPMHLKAWLRLIQTVLG